MTTSSLCLVAAIILLGIVGLASSIRIVPEPQRLRVYRLGRLIGDRGPGVVFVIPIVDHTEVVDTRAKVASVQGIRGAHEAIGKATTAVLTYGKVEVAGEEWDAISLRPIAVGTRVRVLRVILEVGPA